MGNLNFQDEETPKTQPSGQSTQRIHATDDPKLDDIFVDEPTTGTKFLWAAIIVIVIAGVAGGLYLLNKAGYLDFGNKQQTSAVSNQSTPPPGNAPPANVPVQPTGKFTLQIAAFKTKPLADDFVARMKKRGIDAYVASGNKAETEKWFRVYTGAFDNKLLAIAATEEMKKKVGTDVWVVPAP